MWLWQPQLPAARMDHGGSVTVPLWPLHSQPPSLLHSVFLPSCPANRIIHRTAVYGPVRTVVWEGRCREAPPYPDFVENYPNALANVTRVLHFRAEARRAGVRTGAAGAVPLVSGGIEQDFGTK